MYNKTAKAFLKPQPLISLAGFCIIFKTQSVHVVHSVLGNQIYGICNVSSRSSNSVASNLEKDTQ